MTDYVVTGRVKRRAELTGEIESTHERLRQMVLDLEHLDAAILQFDPDFQVEAIRPKAFRPPKDWARRGEMTRIILSILRQAAEPLTTRDIALQLLVERALDKRDQKLLRLMLCIPHPTPSVARESPIGPHTGVGVGIIHFTSLGYQASKRARCACYLIPEIPAKVRAHLGLDGEQCWVIIDEVNKFIWPGPNLSPLPGQPGKFHYGFIPPKLYKKIIAGCTTMAKARQLSSITRTV